MTTKIMTTSITTHVSAARAELSWPASRSSITLSVCCSLWSVVSGWVTLRPQCPLVLSTRSPHANVPRPSILSAMNVNQMIVGRMRADTDADVGLQFRCQSLQCGRFDLLPPLIIGENCHSGKCHGGYTCSRAQESGTFFFNFYLQLHKLFGVKNLTQVRTNVWCQKLSKHSPPIKPHIVRSMRLRKWSKYRIKVINFLTTRTCIKWIHHLKLVTEIKCSRSKGCIINYIQGGQKTRPYAIHFLEYLASYIR